MKEVSIKKLVVLLSSFIVIAVMITTALIMTNKAGSLTDVSSGEEKNKSNHERVIGTKKNQKYNQNDLKIIYQDTNYEGLEYKTLRINGLKNKEIENKINKELEEIEDEIRKKLVSASGEQENAYLSSNVNANYSNILSVTFYGSKSDSNYVPQINIEKFLNYDLTTGNKIKLEDLFLPGTDIDLYAQNDIYKQKLHDSFSKKNIFFNPDYWQSGELQYVLDEVDEIDFIKQYNKYKNSKKDFYLTTTGIGISYSKDGNYGDVYIKYMDCLDNLVVYTKFLTKESIFERDDIGLKDLYVCSSVVDQNDQSVYLIKDLATNLRIDARINVWTSEGYNELEFFKNTLAKLKAELIEKKEEYIKIANENKDKYYFVGIVYDINRYYPKTLLSSYGEEKDIEEDKFIVYEQEKTYSVSMQDFSNWFEDKLIQNYTGNRYTLDYQLYIPISDEEKAKCDIKEKTSSIIYNLARKTSTSDLSGIFEDEIDYTTPISDYLEKYYNIDREKVENMIKNHEYAIGAYAITFKSGDIDATVDYGNFKVSDFR